MTVFSVTTDHVSQLIHCSANNWRGSCLSVLRCLLSIRCCSYIPWILINLPGSLCGTNACQCLGSCLAIDQIVLNELGNHTWFAVCIFHMITPQESLDSEGSSIPESSHHLCSVCGNLRRDECWKIPWCAAFYLYSRLRFVLVHFFMCASLEMPFSNHKLSPKIYRKDYYENSSLLNCFLRKAILFTLGQKVRQCMF